MWIISKLESLSLGKIRSCLNAGLSRAVSLVPGEGGCFASVRRTKDQAMNFQMSAVKLRLVKKHLATIHFHLVGPETFSCWITEQGPFLQEMTAFYL